MKQNLWTRDFSLLIAATAMGALGGTASGFALSFLVFDETGSTLASALLVAMQLIPAFVVPLVAAPWMDRMPRKPFLVAGDAVNGVLYALAGLYLLNGTFHYTAYLGFSLLLSTLGTFDSLAYDSIYPTVIPEGCEQKGYAVSGTLYPVVVVVMTPLAAMMYEHVGVGVILLMQSVLSFGACITESFIRVAEPDRRGGEHFSLRMWRDDLAQALAYLRNEKGLFGIYRYMAVTNGVATGYSPLVMAFFRTAPGLSIAMYSVFSVAECIGRAIGGVVHYRLNIPKQKRFSFAFCVYQFYDVNESLMLWLPYPLMLLGRGVAAFLGVNSASMRQASVQRYIPDHLRAKLNAFSNMLISLGCCIASLALGALGEVLDYRICVSAASLLSLGTCWLTVWRHRSSARRVYEA